VVASYGGLDSALCKVEEYGCPAEDCFCDDTAYWSYWLKHAGVWIGMAVAIPATVAFTPFHPLEPALQDPNVVARIQMGTQNQILSIWIVTTMASTI